MNLITTLHTAFSSIGLPVASPAYEGSATSYIVLTDLGQKPDFIADDDTMTESGEIDIHLFYVGTYTTVVTSLLAAIKAAGCEIVFQQYIEYDKLLNQHHYVITARKREVV